MSRKSRIAADIRREMERIQLRLRRREISPAMYNRLSDKLIQELNGITITEKSEYIDDAVWYSTPGAKIFTSTSARKMTPEEWARFRELQVTQMTGVFDFGSGNPFITITRAEKSVAEQAWDEHGGVVMCECENMKCELVIEITKEEYLHASEPGWRRLTHPNCGYGIMNSQLVGRSERWNVWSKGF